MSIINATAPEVTLDFTSLIQPVPLEAHLESPDYNIWCSSMVRDDKGICHLYYSRWPRQLGHFAWVTHSEVAHAVADDPLGPYRHVEVVLPPRKGNFWDSACTHNPTVHYFEGKYYLYYMGLNADAEFRADISMEDPAWWSYRNSQRIGVAVADDPAGPWKRSDQPCIDVSSDLAAPDSLLVSNPAVTQMPGGEYLMIYKAVGRDHCLPFGGPVVHLSAVGESPLGPFKKRMEPIFTAEGNNFPAEDPYIWYHQPHQCYYAIVKDMSGSFTGCGQSLALFISHDGRVWEPAPNVLVCDLRLHWADGRVDQMAHLERPQLWIEKGVPQVLFLAAAHNYNHSFNIHLPLSETPLNTF